MLAEIISDNFSLFRTNFFFIGLPPGQVSGKRRSVSSIEREEYICALKNSKFGKYTFFVLWGQSYTRNLVKKIVAHSNI